MKQLHTNLFLLCFLRVFYFSASLNKAGIETSHYAIVTLVMGESSGYVAGALALAQSLIDSKSILPRVVMVTSEVDHIAKQQLSRYYEVIDVPTYLCNHISNLNESEFDLNGNRYVKGITRFSKTCTKFAAWTLTQYDRVIFMDSDMIVVDNIDDCIVKYSNASFLASPETFPPDTFNSGFMILNPSIKIFNLLLSLNQIVGSAEGGDQGVFNNAFCPNWFYIDSTNQSCGRLPWIYNVEAHHFNTYKTYQIMANKPSPLVIHFVSDGKPWTILMYEYLSNDQRKQFIEPMKKLYNQKQAHLLWRHFFYKATGDIPSNNEFLLSI